MKVNYLLQNLFCLRKRKLFKHLKNEAKGVMGSEAIKWNFTKFLIDNNGSVIKRYSPQTTPDKIDKDLSKILD